MRRRPGSIGPARVLLRTHRRRLLSWLVPLLALLAIVSPSYHSTYPRLDQRQHVISSLGNNAATRLLYGPLPDPGTIGQLVAWEMGTYLVIAASVLALLLGVSFVRGAEDSGVAELVQAAGHPARARLRGAVAAMLTVTVGLGAAVVLVLGAETSTVGELTWRGALSLGLVTTCSSLFFGLTALVAGELADSSGLAKLLGFIVLAAAFAIRAVANVRGIVGLRWVSPLGWIDVMSPYTRDRWWTGLIFAAVLVGVAALAWRSGSGREYAAAPLHEQATSADRLRVGSVWALTWHLERGRWLAWTVVVAAIAALFGGMSGSMVDLLKGDTGTAKLMRDLTGEDQLDAVFFSFAGVMIGVLVGCYAVSTVLGEAAAEADGLLEDVVGCGVARPRPLAARVGIAAVGSLAMLLVAGGVGALVSVSQLSSGAGRCFAYVAGQWPAVLALAGIGALVVGAWRSWAPVAWVPVAASAVLVMMGSVLHAPHWLQTSAVFAHVPDYAGGAAPSVGVSTLLGCFLVCGALGVWWRARRDLAPD